MRRGQPGFTLVELLVAIAVMALLAIVSWRGLDGMVRAQQITRERADAVLELQTVLAQWGADLDALQAIEHTEPLAWDGQALRLTRRGMRQPDEGAIVVAWALRNADGTNRWLRWQSPPVRTRAEWSEAWARAAQWARTPSSAELSTSSSPNRGWARARASKARTAATSLRANSRAVVKGNVTSTRPPKFRADRLAEELQHSHRRLQGVMLERDRKSVV